MSKRSRLLDEVRLRLMRHNSIRTENLPANDTIYGEVSLSGERAAWASPTRTLVGKKILLENEVRIRANRASKLQPEDQVIDEESWTTDIRLSRAISLQCCIDPDDIFGVLNHIECDLNSIFTADPSYSKRYSTGDWQNDGKEGEMDFVSTREPNIPID
jgi:hypothetical protein